MNNITLDLFLRHKICVRLGVCVGCQEDIEQGGVICHLCLECRYCSFACLQHDRHRHRIVCEILLHYDINGIELSENCVGRIKQILQREHFLDSKGDLFSPEVIHEAYLDRGSNLFARLKSMFIAESRSDNGPCESELQIQNSEQNDIKISLTQKIIQDCNEKSMGSQDSFLERGVQYSVSDLGKEQFGRKEFILAERIPDVENDVMLSEVDFKDRKQESCVSVKSNDINGKGNRDTKNSSSTDSQVTNDSQCSSNRVCENQFNNRIGANSETEMPDTFGNGWWNKNKEHSSKKLEQKDNSKHLPCKIINKIPCEEIVSNISSSGSSVGSHSADSNGASSHSASNHSKISHGTSSQSSADSHSTAAHSASSQSADINSASQNIADKSRAHNHDTHHSTGSRNTEKSQSVNTDPQVSSSNHSPSSSQTRKNTDSDKFGSGWWQVKRPDKSSTTSSPTKHKTSDDKKNKQQSRNSTRNVISSETTCNSDNNQARAANSSTGEQSDSNTFGSGWWQVKKPDKSSTTSSPTKHKISDDKENKQQSHNSTRNKSSSISAISSETTCNSDNNQARTANSSTGEQSDSNAFGSGWWKHRFANTKRKTSPAGSKINSIPSRVNKTEEPKHQSISEIPEFVNLCTDVEPYRICITLDDKENKQQSHNSTRNKSSSISAISSETTCNSDNNQTRTANSSTGEQSDSNAFGSGWWKHRFANTKRKTSPAGSKINSIPSRVNKTEEPKHQSISEIPEFVNLCTDVEPYRICITLELILKFTKVACLIGSRLIEEEANYGRALVMDLNNVPGLWRASLGGSTISLLLEIVGRYPSNMLGIVVRDKYGHTAPVLLNAESSMYTVPRTTFLLPYSDCIRPGNFIILRAVCWEQLPNGKLAIVMRNIKNVSFIFYDELD